MTAERKYPYQNLHLGNLKGELWEDIPGLDGYYRISNFGRTKRMAFEILYSNGQLRQIKEKILTPELAVQKNKSVQDNSYYLRIKMMLAGVVYNFSVARLVYYCFVKKFDLSDYSLVVLAKDCDSKNIRPDNLILVNISRKQKRIFERDRLVKQLPDAYDEFVNQGLTKSSNPFCKQITQYTQEGKKIQTYPSTDVASRILGISENSINSVLKGRQVSGGGFVWRYGDAENVDVEAVREERKLHRKKLTGQKVSQYSREGKRIATYLTITDAAQATGLSTADICAVFNGRQRSAGGYIWKKGWGKLEIDLSNYAIGEEWRAQVRFKKVKQYSPEGKYLQTFNSVKEAAASLGISPSYISSVLNKKRLAKGFLWKSASK